MNTRIIVALGILLTTAAFAEKLKSVHISNGILEAYVDESKKTIIDARFISRENGQTYKISLYDSTRKFICRKFGYKRAFPFYDTFSEYPSDEVVAYYGNIFDRKLTPLSEIYSTKKTAASPERIRCLND